MSREAHVRFCESAGVRFPRATLLLVLDDRHSHRLVAEYIRYFNAARPHQGLRQQTPVPAVRPSDGKVVRLPVLGGLHHDYRRAA
jgi:putative transposase